MTRRTIARITRRGLVLTGAAAGGLTAASLPRRIFAQTSSGQRPQMPYGVQSGDFSADGAVVWSATDRPARLVVEYATTKGFRDAKRIVGQNALKANGYTARASISGVAPGQTVFYRVSFLDLGDYKTLSEPVVGRFRTPPAEKQDVSFVWSADTVGQGWGINPERGGLKTYETMRHTAPDFFIHCGDTIYADNPLQAEVKLPDGTVWRNVVTEAKSKVAETLEEFRGNYRYNLSDESLRRFNAEVPMLAQWDDHEVVDNWYHALRLENDARYREKSAAVLAARASRAFLEWLPIEPDPGEPERIYRRFGWGPMLDVFRIDMRSYRGPNGENRQTTRTAETEFLGAAQLAWLKREIKASTATWKVIAADMPLGLVVWQDWRRRWGSEAVANGDDEVPLGRELEIADLLSFIKRENVRNVAWLTADVHYCATHRYDPEKAAFDDFLPFYEFVSGPIHAGSFGPNALDATFGPQVVFQKAPAPGRLNAAPADDNLYFGHVRIDGRTQAMTVTHRDAGGRVLHTTELASE
jgi:alkaline phosphatase D